MNSTALRARALAAVLVAVSVTMLAGCESAGGAATATNSAAAAGGAASPSKALATAYTGISGTPPATPAVPVPGKTVWVVSCGQQSVSCAGPSAATTQAVQAAGWNAKLCDGQLNPQGWSSCIRQAISGRADGIIVTGVDCKDIQAALQEAKTAGIATVAGGGNDCGTAGQPDLYAAVVRRLSTVSNSDWWQKLGALQADWIIGKTDGNAKVLSVQFTDAQWGAWIQDGFQRELASCSGCTVVSTLKVGNQDVISGQLAQKFSTALLKQPTANAVNVPLDGLFFLGLAQAVQSSGRAKQLSVIGAFGEPANLNLIRKDAGEDATVGYCAAWGGWAAVDALVRLFAKLPIQPAGVGLQVIDAEHNMPAGQAAFSYNPPVDYAAAYRKNWGKA